MIRKFLNNNILLNSKPSSSVASAAFLITLAGLSSRVLGLLRDALLTSKFSAGDTTDIYFAAFRVPDLIYNLLILGALSAAFIPVFTGLISNKKEEDAWRLANGVMNIAIFFIVVISLILAIFAPYVMKIITPGFSPEKLEKVIIFTRIMFLSPLFLGISGILGGILTSYKRFLIYSFAPVFYNLGIIIGIVFFTDFWGPVGLAWGVVFGALLHMMVQYPAARNLGFRYHWSVFKNFANNDVRDVIRLMIPRTLGIAISQINLTIITIFASLLAAGSLSVFNFAQNIQSVPLGLIGISFSIAVFPTLSAFWSRNEKEEFVRSFSDIFRQILFFVVPMSVFMILLRAQIVRIILGHGKFDWEDTTLTFECLGIFALSLFAQCVIPLLARSFYAMRDTKTPFYIAIITEIVNISAVILLIGKFQVLGLAIAFSLSSLVQMMLLLFVLRSKFDNFDEKKIMGSIFKIALATFFAGVAVQIGKIYAAKLVDMDTFIGVFTQLLVSGGLGLVVFAGFCQILKLEEFEKFKKSFSKRIFKAKKYIMEDTGEVSGL